MYAAEFRRPGRADEPVHYREQLQTIRRESILAMTLRVEAALPTRLKVQVSVKNARRSPAKKKKKEKKAAKQKKQRSAGLKSRSRYSISSARNSSSPSANRSTGPGRRPAILARLFALRKTLSQRVPLQLPPIRTRLCVRSVRRPHRHAPRSIPDGPARRAAAKFQLELNTAADRVLRKVFSRRRAN